MAGQVQALRRRIRTVKSTKKIAKAQELVATSRIAKAQERVAASKPYAEAITQVLTALASNATIDNPLLVPRERVRRAGVLLITSDRGLAGAYNANAIRTAEQLIQRLKADGKDTVLYVVGRKGVGYYRFRNRRSRPAGPGSPSGRPFRTRRGSATRCWRPSWRARTTPTSTTARTTSRASTSCTSSARSSSR